MFNFKNVFKRFNNSEKESNGLRNKQGFTPTPKFFGVSSQSERGFTLIELLVVISIIGFLVVASVVIFNIVRMKSRDATRAANVATISRALAMYLNESTVGYPASAGECLSNGTGVGAILMAAEMIVKTPLDPLWPIDEPDPDVAGDLDGFCYYYESNNNDVYYISYYLESNSKSGSAGPHTTVAP